MEEKRKTTRRYLLYYMRIYDAANKQQIGNLVDITPRGIMIVSDKAIPEGQMKKLRMELTPEVAEKPYMEFTALSRWTKPDIDPNMYNTGFEITDLAEEDGRIIQKIVEEFGFRDNTPSL